MIPLEHTPNPVPTRIMSAPNLLPGSRMSVPHESTIDIDHNLYQSVVMNILVYLSSSSPDIRESERTKKIYRKPSPSSQIRNRMAEVHEEEVGFEFGSAFRKFITRYETPSGKDKTGRSTSAKKHRPHMRRAHWHTYCTGAGRTERRLVWLHELFVNRGSQEVSATIHPVS